MVSCDRCRQEQMLAACCRGGLLRRSRRLRHRPEAVDLISALPDDLLFQILVRLRCARAAARTSLVSRRWRDLWTRLPELTFHRICPDPLDDALAMASTTAALSLLDICIFNSHSLATARIYSLIQAAARLAPATLRILVYGDRLHNRIEDAVELPCFHRSTGIWLGVADVHFTLPAAGDFPVLETLSLDSSHIDLADLIPRCPRLRKLWISSRVLQSVTVHAPLLEELNVYSSGRIHRIDISAPLLKKLRLHAGGGLTTPSNEFSLSYSAPMVEELSWKCDKFSNVGFGQIWRLGSLSLGTQEIPVRNSNNQLTNNDREISCHHQEQRPRVNVLSLYIGTSDILSDPSQSITQAISKVLVTSFSILELKFTRSGHVYGPMVLHVLGDSNFVQSLKVEVCKVSNQETCGITCPCDHPNNWSSQSISLTYLKEVEIKGFRGENHEVDLLKLILRSATTLGRMALFYSSEVQPSRNSCMEVYHASKAYPSVACNIYNCAGEQVPYA